MHQPDTNIPIRLPPFIQHFAHENTRPFNLSLLFTCVQSTPSPCTTNDRSTKRTNAILPLVNHDHTYFDFRHPSRSSQEGRRNRPLDCPLSDADKKLRAQQLFDTICGGVS